MVSKRQKTYKKLFVGSCTYAPVNLTAACIIFSGGQFSILGGLAHESRKNYAQGR